MNVINLDEERKKAVTMALRALQEAEESVSADAEDFARLVMSMSPQHRAKLKRVIFLMKNSTPRTERFIGLLNLGQLSGRDFLDLI